MFAIPVILLVLLLLYILYLQRQLGSLNRQLLARLKEKSRQPLRLELFNRELNRLAANMNQCLMEEEKLNREGIRREKEFKELIANLSHDLRTPLTALLGYQQLMEEGELAKEQRERLNIAKKHAGKLGNLIEHFFEYSYLLNAEPEIRPEKINLTKLVTEYLALSVAVLEEHKLSVLLTEAVPVFVIADQEMLIRIIQNLIRNCIAHSAGDITVRFSKEGRGAVFFENPVDHPLEIDTDRLFDRFYTGGGNGSSSTGLGLSIVRTLAEKMGGSADASLNGAVLTICVSLPLFR